MLLPLFQREVMYRKEEKNEAHDVLQSLSFSSPLSEQEEHLCDCSLVFPQFVPFFPLVLCVGKCCTYGTLATIKSGTLGSHLVRPRPNPTCALSLVARKEGMEEGGSRNKGSGGFLGACGRKRKEEKRGEERHDGEGKKIAQSFFHFFRQRSRKKGEKSISVSPPPLFLIFGTFPSRQPSRSVGEDVSWHYSFPFLSPPHKVLSLFFSLKSLFPSPPPTNQNVWHDHSWKL